MTDATLSCEQCGFQERRWSRSDIERTLAHADDLIGYVLEGASDAFVAQVVDRPVERDDDLVVAAHVVMHRLHDIAAARRAADDFEPMIGHVESLQAPISAAGIEVFGTPPGMLATQ